jgi:hypothetical protein
MSKHARSKIISPSQRSILFQAIHLKSLHDEKSFANSLTIVQYFNNRRSGEWKKNKKFWEKRRGKADYVEQDDDVDEKDYCGLSGVLIVPACVTGAHGVANSPPPIDKALIKRHD